MLKTEIENRSLYGDKILSGQVLGTKVSRLTWAVVALGVFVVGSTAYDAIKPDPRPLLLDTSTGNIITDYKHVLEGYTVEERMLLASLAYNGFRQRTGIAAIDAETLKSWSDNITPNGLAAWSNLGQRWTKPGFVQPGFSRTIRVISTRPDKNNAYAFTIEAVESESEVGKPLSNKQFRVRLTLFFTDPSVDKVMKIDGVVLHEEELLK